MTQFDVRPFRRADRDQVTLLVNRHAAAVIPGVSASVATVLNQLEREPDEFVVGPWVEERRCLVAEQDGAVVAAALLARYRDDDSVGPDFRGAGEIRWLLFWPEAPLGNPFWRPAGDAAAALLTACVEQLRRWCVTRVYADGALPLPAVYGVPEQWPHVEQLYTDHGFTAPAQDVAPHLLRHAAQWLRLAGVDRLLHYAALSDVAAVAFAAGNGFVEVTRTRRGWERPLLG